MSSAPFYNIYFILVYVLIFSLANYLRDKETIEDNQVALSMFLNSFGGFGLFLLITLTKFQEYLAHNYLSIDSPNRLETPVMNASTGITYLAGKSEENSDVTIIISNFEADDTDYLDDLALDLLQSDWEDYYDG